MTPGWAGVLVSAAGIAVAAMLLLGGGLFKWSNRLSAVLERLTIASERHDTDLAERREVDERHDGQLRDLTAAIRALAEHNGRPMP